MKNAIAISVSKVLGKGITDATPPTVVITSSLSGMTATSPIPVTFTFSEPVTGFVVGDITVGNGTAGNFAGSGASYTANITPTAAGTVTVNVGAGVCIDAAGNGNTAATQWSILFASAPTAAMGWREYWNAMDITKLYQAAQATPVTADGQAVYDMNGNLGVVANSYFRQATEANRPLYKTGGANDKSYLSFDGTQHKMDSLAVSNFLAVGAKTILVAVSIGAGIASGADGIIGDNTSPYEFIAPYTGNLIKYLNYSGGNQISTGQSYVDNTVFVYVVKHDTGSLYDTINGVAWSAGVASGNTGTLTRTLGIGYQGTSYTAMKFYAAAMSNAVISDANLTLCINYFKSQLGIA